MKLVKEISEDHKVGLRFQAMALACLQEASEIFLTDWFSIV